MESGSDQATVGTNPNCEVGIVTFCRFRHCAQHCWPGDEHPHEVDQADPKHDQGIDPGWAEQGIAEDRQLEEQPHNRENDDGPLKGSQSETVRLRQVTTGIDVQEYCSQVDDGWQQGGRAEEIAKRVALAWYGDAQNGKTGQHDFDENAAQQRSSCWRAGLAIDCPEQAVSRETLVTRHGPGQARRGDEDDQAAGENREGDENQEDITNDLPQYPGDNVRNGSRGGGEGLQIA